MNPMFCVIIDVGNSREDNLTDVFLVSDGQETYVGLPDDQLEVVGHAKMPIFIRGEFLVLSESGCEISGRGRKPEKWFITYELYSDPNVALQRAMEVSDVPLGKPVPAPSIKPDHVQTADMTRRATAELASIISDIPKEVLETHPFVQSIRAALDEQNPGGKHIIQGGMQDFKKWAKEWKENHGSGQGTRTSEDS